MLESSMHLPQPKDIHDNKSPQREHQGNTCAIYVRRGLQNKYVPYNGRIDRNNLSLSSLSLCTSRHESHIQQTCIRGLICVRHNPHSDWLQSYVYTHSGIMHKYMTGLSNLKSVFAREQAQKVNWKSITPRTISRCRQCYFREWIKRGKNQK